MKAVILATCATIATFALAVLVFQTWTIERRARALLLIYLITVLALASASLITSSDLSLLPAALVAGPPWVDFLACLFFYSCAFFGGILQLYNLADRGLSLRILIDAYEHRHERATADELARDYSAGRGLVWMYDKRLHGMVASNLIHIDAGHVTLTQRGRRVACAYGSIRRLLRTRIP